MSTEMTDKRLPHSICLVRNYAPEKDRQGEVPSNVRRMNQQCDAVLRLAAQNNDAQSMEMVNDIDWVINCVNHPIQLTHDVTVTVTDITRSNNPDKQIALLRVQVTSDTLKAKELIEYVTKLYRDYHSSMQTDLVGHQFYFDQKYRNNERLDLRGNPHEGGDPRMAKKHELNVAPKHLSFCKYGFRSNKSFNNLFGQEIDQIKARVERFINNKDWYEEKGVPYQLGICLSGTPGTGKTSCIGAIANLTKRHVINVNCANILTHTQLKRLFYEEDLHVYTDEDLKDTVRLHIPIEHRIYVLEELDAVGQTLYQRDDQNNGSDDDPIYDELTLGHWLQIFDDVNQVQGRIMVITTNHPEKLDAALLRPGRIDINVSLDKASCHTVAKMYQHFTEHSLTAEQVMKLPNHVLSPAEVSNVLQMHIDNPEGAFNSLMSNKSNSTESTNTVVKQRHERKVQTKAPPAGVHTYNTMMSPPSSKEIYSMFD